jgi:hypothetical protein
MLTAILTGSTEHDGAHVAGYLSVYQRAYTVRWTEVLRSRFPSLLALVGDQVFDLFALSYLRSHPPSEDLASWVVGFPDHLEATRPPDSATSLPAAVARLELASP